MIASRLARPSSLVVRSLTTSQPKSGALARPGGMRGQLMKNISKNMGVAFVLATGVTYAWYIGVVKARKDVYAEFHRTVDVDAMYERMKSKGVFWAFKAIEEYQAEQAGEEIQILIYNFTSFINLLRYLLIKFLILIKARKRLPRMRRLRP
jgi:hypothetical protein